MDLIEHTWLSAGHIRALLHLGTLERPSAVQEGVGMGGCAGILNSGFVRASIPLARMWKDSRGQYQSGSRSVCPQPGVASLDLCWL